MILRVTRSRVQRGAEGQVLDVIRRLTESFGPIPGLHAAYFGRSVDETASMSLIAITMWDDLDAIKRVYGPDWASRSLLPGVEEVILETTVEHFESTLDDVASFVESYQVKPER